MRSMRLRWAGAALGLLALLAALLPAAAPRVAAQEPAPAGLLGERRIVGSGADATNGVAAGDLNGDGHLDIVVANGVFESVLFPGDVDCPEGNPDCEQNVILLNDGGGGFYSGPIVCGQSPGVLCFGPPGALTYSVAVGDLDRDGDLDLVTGVNGQSYAYLNTGGGAMSAGIAFGDARHTNGVALGDVNGDGWLDIAAGRSDGFTGWQSRVYLSSATTPPTFAQSRTFGLSSDYTFSVAMGDLNGDAHLDIVAGTPAGALFFANDGAGNFPSRVAVGAFGGIVGALALGDLDGDGDLDIATGADGQSRVFLNSAGSFATAIPIGPATGEATLSLAVGDLDGDGDLDIAAGNKGSRRGQIYLNDGATPPAFAEGVAFGTGVDVITSLAVGDLDSDGDLDLLAGSYSGSDFDRSGRVGFANALYLNSGASRFPAAAQLPFGPADATRYAVALGDLDGDGDLDLVSANRDPLNPGLRTNTVHLNSGAGSLAAGTGFGAGLDSSFDVALGDLDGDGDLDAAVANSGQNALYLNSGAGALTTRRTFGPALNDTFRLALGDLDGDGDLDIVAANVPDPARGTTGEDYLYLNDGAANFTVARLLDADPIDTLTVALGDLDGDGDLDIVTGRFRRPSQIFLNDGAATFTRGATFGDSLGETRGLALGDLDGDGDLDIAAGVSFGQNKVYLNDGAGGIAGERLFGTGGDFTVQTVLADVDLDGDLDILTANLFIEGNDRQQSFIYRNDGRANLTAGIAVGAGLEKTLDADVGDLDGDGDPDVVFAVQGQQAYVYRNPLVGARQLPNTPPRLTIGRVGPTAAAPLLSTPAIISRPTIAIPYRLADPDGDPVRRVRAFYSLDGGGSWRPALPAAGTVTENLAAPAGGSAYTFTWDVYASGFFGQSDMVALRLVAESAWGSRARGVVGAIPRPFVAAQTFPLRVRGAQVRVMRGAAPAVGAMVYRLPAGASDGARPFASGERTLLTDQGGYLQGRGALAAGDQLAALLPVATTDGARLFHTSAAPVSTGLDMATIGATGPLTLTIRTDSPLVLFDLEVALEWDARADAQYLTELERDLRRTAELLYDWTDGQASLGRLTISQGRERWNDAHIRIYATNRMRPNANQGGIVLGPLVDPAVPAITYESGQVRMGATWNRYGEPSGGSLGEDWPRTLAHELGHFALFLDDNYLGLDDAGLLISVPRPGQAPCPGAMSDPYRDDYSEFHPSAGWSPACDETLSERLTGRADWETFKAFYDRAAPAFSLREPAGFGANPGPSTMPLALTELEWVAPAAPATTLPVPIYALRQPSRARYVASSGARAFLFSGERLTDLGSPTQDQLLARGARPGDRLCVFDLPAQSMGCGLLDSTGRELDIAPYPGWLPDVAITPVTSRTVQIQLSNVPADLPPVQARLYPGYVGAGDPASYLISLARVGGVYSGTVAITAADPSFSGYVHLWVQEGGARRETVVDYAIGGSPGRVRTRGAPRGNPGRVRTRGAPVLSADGQVILFGKELDFAVGSFFSLQTAAAPPEPPAWATLVGQAYRLSASASAPALAGTSLHFNYLGRDLPPGGEPGLRIYYWDGAAWERLPTVLDPDQNTASAPTQGPGIYALMSSVTVPIGRAGWNMVAYPVHTSRPVAAALASISGSYTTVYGYEPGDLGDPWKLYDVGLPAWANDLAALEYGRGYWIRATEALTIYFKGDLLSAPQEDGPPAPPASFYGVVFGGGGLTPQAGLPVQARIGDQLCGQGQTRLAGGQVVYVVDVVGDAGGATAGCGAAGRPVRFVVGGRPMAQTRPWSNDRPQPLNLSVSTEAPGRLYLPLLRR